MKIGVSFFPSRPKLVIPLAQTADETGFESVWIPEHAVFPTQIETAYPYAEVDPPLPTTPLYDPLIMLTYVAAVTQRVKLGTGIYILPQRHPILVARMLTSVDILSAGRVLFGVGAGWLREEMEALDSDFSTRGPRTDEMIGILRRLWTEPRVAHQGRFYSFPEVGFEPKPVQGTVPILVGGESPPALRRAARLGDGWFGMGHTPESAREAVGRLRALREEAGRGSDPLEVTLQSELKPTVENLRRYEDAGVDRICLSHRLFATEDRQVASSAAAMERFANEVLVKL